MRFLFGCVASAVCAVAATEVRWTSVTPLIDAYPEPPVWEAAEPMPHQPLAWRAVWDAEALYLYIDVTDTGRTQQDGLELLVRDRRYTLRYESDFSGTTTVGVQVAQANREGGYRFEVRLPWTALGGFSGSFPAAVWLRGTERQWSEQLQMVDAQGRALLPAPPPPKRDYAGKALFYDMFGPESRGERVENIVQLPPPAGLGYKTRYPHGYRPLRWSQIDTRDPADPKRGFWIVAEGEGVLVQAGRSIPSWIFANTPVPEGAAGYTIVFKQRRFDNDPVSFIIGASQPSAKHDGVEWSYETQVPGSDKTTSHAYIKGALGELVQPDQAWMHQWVEHRIVVRGKNVRWYQAEKLMAEAEVPKLGSGGYFGIKHVSERDTAYDDVRIYVEDPR